jgi:alkyl hydroperoxide reductase subunit F
MYDCIIIGAGPAGLTAAIYTARKKLKTLVLSRDIGGQMAWSSDVENYTGFSFITGVELTQKFKAHAEQLKEDLEILEGEEVVKLEKNISSFITETKSGKSYFSKAVIIATGKRPRMLGIPGEKQYMGKGVAVCATCDAPLYKNKSVVVIGGGNSAMDTVISLSGIAKQVTIVTNLSKLTADAALVQKVTSLPHINFLYDVVVKEIIGQEIISGVKIERGNKQEELKADGVFIEIGWEPNTAFEILCHKNPSGEVIVDRNLQTNVPGLFAAGDVNDSWGEQIVIAAGEGAKAAISASRYLRSI